MTLVPATAVGAPTLRPHLRMSTKASAQQMRLVGPQWLGLGNIGGSNQP